MKTACFIPIKENSERVPGKNFRVLNGKKLYEYIIEYITEAGCFDDVYVDTNSKEIMEYADMKQLHVIERQQYLAENTANGNDLMVYHQKICSDYDYYFQVFATAPYLQPESIRKCCDMLVSSEEYDSCFTATQNHGFYWLNNIPVNYRPGILPRSQDMPPMVEESTGLYGIKRSSIEKYKCRIGKKPYIYIINKFEAVDINTEDDLKLAEFIGKSYWGY